MKTFDPSRKTYRDIEITVELPVQGGERSCGFHSSHVSYVIHLELGVAGSQLLQKYTSLLP